MSGKILFKNQFNFPWQSHTNKWNIHFKAWSQETALIPNPSGIYRAKDLVDSSTHHIFLLSSPKNYRKIKDINTTVAEFSKDDLIGKKKKGKKLELH